MRGAGGQLRAVGALLGAVALWSGSLSVVRIAVDGAAPGTVTFWRCVVGALVLYAWALHRQRRRGVAGLSPRPRRRDWAWAIASGASCGCAFLLIAVGMEDVGSGPAGIVLSAIPGLTVLLAALEPGAGAVGTRQLLSLGVGAIGALALALPGGGGWALTGLLALGAAALAHAATNVSSGRCLARLDPIVVAAMSMGVAALVVAPFAQPAAGMPPLRSLVAIALLGLLPSGIAYVLYFEGIRVLGSARAAFSNFLVPPVAVASGVVALGEVPDAWTLLALVLAMAALAIGLGGRRAGGVPVPAPVAVSAAAGGGRQLGAVRGSAHPR